MTDRQWEAQKAWEKEEEEWLRDKEAEEQYRAIARSIRMDEKYLPPYLREFTMDDLYAARDDYFQTGAIFW